MSFVRPAIERMSGYVPGLQPTETKYVKLNTNENPYPPSPKVLAAIAKETERLRLYPDPDSTLVRQAAAQLAGLDPDWVIAGRGSDEMLTILCRTVVGAGDRVYFPYPTYSLYDVLVDIQEGVNCPVDFPKDWTLPKALFGNRGVLTFVANPNAPSGTMVPPGEIARLAESLSGLLVVDEAYVDFADQNCAALVSDHKNLVVLRSLSKSYSLAGLRVGYGLAHPDVIRELLKVKDSYNLDRLAIVGAAAALEDQEHMRQNAARVRVTRGRLVQGLEDLGFTTTPSVANFVLTTPPGPHQAESVYQQLWDRHQILVRYFHKRRLENSLRISVGTDEEIDLLLAAIDKVLSPGAGQETNT